ncbi:MAG TPA: hypothetical protein VE781_16060 [Kineosporiaceae bacterium]|nr:hypothetical protein [Kineosporiaceae bacterium]
MSAGVWWRTPVIAAGLGVLGYGLWLVVTSGAPFGVAVWLAGSLVGHDGVLAPLAVLAGAVVVRLVPAGPVRRVVAGGLSVAACLVLVALPALGTPGVPGNPTATPRDYPLGLAVLLALVAAGTAVLAVIAGRARASGRGADADSGS